MRLWCVQPLFIHGRFTEHESCFAGAICFTDSTWYIPSYQTNWMGWLSASFSDEDGLCMCLSNSHSHQETVHSLNYWAPPPEQLGIVLIDKPRIITSDTGLYLITTTTPWAYCVMIYTTHVFHNLCFVFWTLYHSRTIVSSPSSVLHMERNSPMTFI